MPTPPPPPFNNFAIFSSSSCETNRGREREGKKIEEKKNCSSFLGSWSLLKHSSVAAECSSALSFSLSLFLLSLCSLIYQRILSLWSCAASVHLFAHRWPPKCGTSFAFKMFSLAQFQPQLWPFIWHISLCWPEHSKWVKWVAQCLFVFPKLPTLLSLSYSPPTSIYFDDGLGALPRIAVTFGNKIVFKIRFYEVGAF